MLAAEQSGKRIAALVFDERSHRRPQRNVEVHMSEAELAEWLAAAFEEGYRTGQDDTKKDAKE